MFCCYFLLFYPLYFPPHHCNIRWFESRTPRSLFLSSFSSSSHHLGLERWTSSPFCFSCFLFPGNWCLPWSQSHVHSRFSCSPGEFDWLWLRPTFNRWPLTSAHQFYLKLACRYRTPSINAYHLNDAAAAAASTQSFKLLTNASFTCTIDCALCMCNQFTFSELLFFLLFSLLYLTIINTRIVHVLLSFTHCLMVDNYPHLNHAMVSIHRT